MRDPTSEEFRDGMPFLGGRLWLDFLNTTPATAGDLIATPDGLVRWIRAAGLEQLADEIGLEAMVGEASRLRSALRALYVALSKELTIPTDALAVVNIHLLRRARRERLIAEAARITAITESEVTGSAPLALIAADFAAFAPDCQAHRLRKCANDECTMVFYDTAKNATRRWCSMAVCGNRRKIAAYRARERE